MADSPELGIIGKTMEDGLPVIFKLVDEVPSEEDRAALPWLTVISWKYDGAARNGMPEEDDNQRMIELERAVEKSVLAADRCRHAYSRTGNGLKELVYYIADRQAFMESFNAALSGHPRYPIEINFYQDLSWADFRKLLDAFRTGK